MLLPFPRKLTLIPNSLQDGHAVVVCPSFLCLRPHFSAADVCALSPAGTRSGAVRTTPIDFRVSVVVESRCMILAHFRRDNAGAGCGRVRQ